MKKIVAFFAALFAGIGERLHDAVFGYMENSGLVLGMMRNVPTPEQFVQFQVTNPQVSEIVWQPLYDYQLYPTAGVQQMAFFQSPISQGITSALGATVGTTKTEQDTNMSLSGQLASGLNFLIERIELQFQPGSVSTANTFTPATVMQFAAVAAATVGGAMNDVSSFYLSGLLEFNVLQKNYLRLAPLIHFGSAAKFELQSAVASNSATTGEVTSGIMHPKNDGYDLESPVSLLSAVNFNVTLKWPAVVPTPSGFNGRVGVILRGWTYRAGQ
jgi:hypothetical protein